jgi:hypothetical protein
MKTLETARNDRREAQEVVCHDREFIGLLHDCQLVKRDFAQCNSKTFVLPSGKCKNVKFKTYKSSFTCPCVGAKLQGVFGNGGFGGRGESVSGGLFETFLSPEGK